MIKSKLSKAFLTLIAMASIIIPSTTVAHADTVSGTTQITGTFDAVTLNVSIPATSSFTYNPDSGSMVAQTFDIANNSQAPVAMNVKSIAVSPSSAWKPNLVAPYSISDWNNLTKAQTMSNVSLGLLGYTSDPSWLNGIQVAQVWCSDLGSPIQMGVIRTNSSIGVEPTLKSGTSIDTQSVLTANYVFEFGLAN